MRASMAKKNKKNNNMLNHYLAQQQTKMKLSKWFIPTIRIALFLTAFSLCQGENMYIVCDRFQFYRP